MTKAINANYFVRIIPGVIAADGSAIDLNGLFLTTSQRVPTATVQEFPNDGVSVGAYFGASSPEAAQAAVYFAGSDGASILPSTILFAQYNPTAVSAWLRGGPLSLTLTQLKALTGVLAVVVDGVLHTSSAINLSAATSFSNAATLILADFTNPGFTIAYDAISTAFVITSLTTGATSTIDFASGSIAAGLGLTYATGAVDSQGAVAVTDPVAFMNGINDIEQDWVTLVTLFDPDGGNGNTLKQAFSTWTNSQQYAKVYACWDTDLSPTTQSQAAGSLGDILTNGNTSGTALIATPSCEKASMLAGFIAAINWNEKDGRTNLAFRSQSGLSADITSTTAAANLKANGYNFYGRVKLSKKTVNVFSDGRISGSFKWLDSFVNQILINANLQLDVFTLMTVMKSIPYNAEGYGYVYAACLPTIQAAVNFGAIRKGVQLSASQAAQVNAAAGVAIDGALFSEGWYLQILPASADVRSERDSPPCKFWYMDGESINGIVLESLNVQ